MKRPLPTPSENPHIYDAEVGSGQPSKLPPRYDEMALPVHLKERLAERRAAKRGKQDPTDI